MLTLSRYTVGLTVGAILGRLHLPLPTPLVRDCVWCQQVIGFGAYADKHLFERSILDHLFPIVITALYNCLKTRRVHSLLLTISVFSTCLTGHRGHELRNAHTSRGRTGVLGAS